MNWFLSLVSEIRSRPGVVDAEVHRPSYGGKSRAVHYENVLVGIVERVNFQGSYCECHVRVAGTTIRAPVPSASSVSVSERVWLTINPERCTLFALR